MLRPRSPRLATTVAVCLALSVETGRAQTPQRLVDLHPTAIAGDSTEHRLAILGSDIYFGGVGTATGVEPYRVAFGSSTPRLVKDIYPGVAGSYPFGMTILGSRLYFVVADRTHGYELWSTDGTTTSLVKDVYPGVPSSMVPDDTFRAPMGVLNGALLFCADDGVGGYALWRSDGTASGTTPVKKIGNWSKRTPCQEFLTVGSFGLFFTRNDSTRSFDLWQTDGKAAGTRALRSFPALPDLPLRIPFKLHRVDNAVYVTGLGTLVLVEPAATTTKITTLLSSSGFVHSGFGSVRDAQTQKRVFVFSGGTYLWRSDGTARGTVPFYPRSGLGVLNSFEQHPAVARNQMVFFGFDIKHGEEPWITDGTESGTSLLKDLRVGPRHSMKPSRHGDGPRVVTDGTRFYFAADDGVKGLELWTTDGSPSGTRLVADLNPGDKDSAPRSILALPRGGVVFVADDSTGARVWTYDPSTSKVRRVADNFDSFPGRTNPSRVLGLTAHDGRLYFAGDDGKSGSELWCSNGTAGGTIRVRDILPGFGSSLRHHDLTYGPDYGALAAIGLGADLYFNAYAAAGRLALYRTDGSTIGTKKVRDLDLIGGGGWGLRGIGIGETLFFQGYEKTSGEGLFALRAGSSSMAKLAGTQPGQFFALGSKLVFTDGEPPALRGIWVSDGTANGTKALLKFSRFVPGPFHFARVGRRAFFSVMRGSGELWRTDGSVSGTTQIRGANVRGMAVSDDQLFTLEEVSGNVELRRGDGTSTGTTVIANGLPLTSQELLATGSRLFFVAFLGSDSELWTSDGTKTGTVRLAKFPANGSVTPRLDGLLGVGSRRVMFRVSSSYGVGVELWQSDGTVAGTIPVDDIERGPGGKNGEQLVLVAGKLFFVAADGRRGSVDGDLWTMESGAVTYEGVAGCAADGFAPRLTGTDPVLAGKMDITLRASAQKSGLFLLGVALRRAVALGRGCRIHPDPGTAFLTPIGTNTAGKWAMRDLPIPNQPSLKGMSLVAQVAISGQPSMPPLGANLSNSLILVVGN